MTDHRSVLVLLLSQLRLPPEVSEVPLGSCASMLRLRSELQYYWNCGVLERLGWHNIGLCSRVALRSMA